METCNAPGLPLFHRPSTLLQCFNYILTLRKCLLPSFVALFLLKDFDQLNKLILHLVMSLIKLFKVFFADLSSSPKTLTTGLEFTT
jgi:hypothetical protein